MIRRKLFLLIGALALNMYMPLNVQALENKGTILENKGVIENKKVPVYDFVYTFNGGIARVEKDGKYGFIDKEGNVIVEPKYTYAYDFDLSGTFAKIIVDNEEKYINKEGKIIEKSKVNLRKKLNPEKFKEFVNKFEIEHIKWVDGGQIVVDNEGNTIIDKYRSISFRHNYYGDGVYEASSEEGFTRATKLEEQGIDYQNNDELRPFAYYIYDIDGKKLSPNEYSWLRELDELGVLYGKVYDKEEIHWIDCKEGIIKKVPYRQITSPHCNVNEEKVLLGYTDKGIPKYRKPGKLYDLDNNDITDKFIEINNINNNLYTDDYYTALIVPDDIRDKVESDLRRDKSIFWMDTSIWDVTTDITIMLFYPDGTPMSPKEYSFLTGFNAEGKQLGKVSGKNEMDVIDFEKGIIDTVSVNMKEDKDSNLPSLLYKEGVMKYLKRDKKNGTSYAVMNDEGKVIAEYVQGFGHYPLGDTNFDNFNFRSLVSIGNITGTREKDSTIEEDIKVLNEKFVNKVGYDLVSRGIFNNGGVLLWDKSNVKDNYDYVVRRDNQGFATIGMRDWWNQTCFSDMGYNMSDLNVVLEIFKYYAGKDGERIFEYINNKFLSGENIDFGKKIKFGDTTIVITDPISYKGKDFGYKDIDVHILSKGEENKVDIANLDLEKIDVSKVELSDENEIVKEEIKRDPKKTAYEDGQLFNKKFEGKYHLKFDKYASLCQQIRPDGEGYNLVLLKDIDVLVLERDNENPVISLSLWPNRKEKGTALIDKFAFEIVPVFKEVVQYYAENPKDAQAIFDFIDEYYGDRKPIDMTKIYKFGDTLIKFRREDSYNGALEIVFLGKEK